MAAPGNNAQHPGTGWIWDSPSPRHCSRYLPVCSLWVISIIPCLLIHYSQVNPCVVAWKWNIKRDFYINFYLNMVLWIFSRLKKEALSKTRSAHICCEGTGVIPSIFKEWPTAHWWIISRHFHSYLWLQQLKLLPSLSLGMFLGGPAAAWISIAVGSPSTGGQHFTHALSIRQQSSWLPPFSSFHPSLSQGKIQIPVSLLREQENRDQHPAALGMLCSPFKKLSFKKCVRVATLCSFSVLSWSQNVLRLNQMPQGAEQCTPVSHPK